MKAFKVATVFTTARRNRPNHALELTGRRIVLTFSMTTSFSRYLTLALGGRSSACFR